MVIDNRTGRGCAWSLTAKQVARRLIEDGILDQEIARKQYKHRCDSIRVLPCGDNLDDARVWRVEGKGTPDGPLWKPSFIEPGKWERAVEKFQVFEYLERNVQRYLLPEMGDYLHSLTEEELASLVRNFLLENGVLQTPIRQANGNTYYFNEREIYCVDERSRLFPYDGRHNFYTFKILGETGFKMSVWSKAVTSFGVGMSLGECVGVFLETKLAPCTQRKLTPMEQLVQEISPPSFEREPENEDPATFDRIRIRVGLPRYHFPSWEALREEVKKHRREIYRLVVRKLEQSRRFRRYGVPMGCLKLSDVILRRNYSLEFIFEWKDKDGGSPGFQKE